MRGPGLPGRQIVANECFTRELLYAKMLEETEPEETGYFVTFLSLVALQLRGCSALPPLATPMDGGELLLKNGTIDGYAY